MYFLTSQTTKHWCCLSDLLHSVCVCPSEDDRSRGLSGAQALGGNAGHCSVLSLSGLLPPHAEPTENVLSLMACVAVVISGIPSDTVQLIVLKCLGFSKM